MTISRPGYVWDGTQWVSFGPEAGASTIPYQASAPVSPSTGDLWVDADADVPAVSVIDAYTKSETNTLLNTKSSVDTTGLVLLNTTTFTSATSVTFNNCFNATYDNYRLVFSLRASIASDTALQLRSNGVNATGNNYRYAHMYVNAGTGLGANTLLSTSYSLVDNSNSSIDSNFSVDVFNPFQAKLTAFANGVNFRAADNFLILNGGRHELGTSYDGFQIYPYNGGNLTGTVKVYGYK